MKKLEIETLKNIYAHLNDDLSKNVFEKRILWSITGDEKYETMLVDSNPDVGKMIDRLKYYSRENRKIVVMGNGKIGRRLVNTHDDIKWTAFIDNYPKEELLYGLKVYTAESFLSVYSNEIIVISSKTYAKEMEQQLLHYNIPKENIVNYGEILNEAMKNQYFDLKNIKWEDEIFVDLGCRDGETDRFLKERIKDKLKYIYAFEPDIDALANCRKTLDKLAIDYTLIEKGGWSRDTVIYGYMHESGNLVLTETKQDKGFMTNVVALDNVLEGKQVTFIKMDIEGAELEALKGSVKTIKKYAPKLAICVYHKEEDIHDIPAFILECNPEYKLFLRHYGHNGSETVLYAIP